MEEIKLILSVLKEFSPMGTIALALIVIWQLVKQRKDVKVLKDNHSHEIIDALKRIEEKLDKINDNVIWLKSRANNSH